MYSDLLEASGGLSGRHHWNDYRVRLQSHWHVRGPLPLPVRLHENTAPNVVFYILSRDRIRQNKRRNVLLFEFIQVSGNLVDIEVNSSAVQLPYYGNSLPSLKRWVCRDDIYIKKILLICITFISQNGILIFFFMGILTTLLWVLGTEKSGLK